MTPPVNKKIIKTIIKAVCLQHSHPIIHPPFHSLSFSLISLYFLLCPLLCIPWVPHRLPTYNYHYFFFTHLSHYSLLLFCVKTKTLVFILMGESMEAENAAFWLPKHFLTDDDFLTHDKDSSGFGFGFGSDPFDSPVSSTDNDENNHDDDVSLVSHLTRHLARTSLHDSFNTKNTTSERPWVFSTSPQSTLSGFGGGWSNTNRSGFSSNGSPNGPSRVPSPPLTPELQNDAAWDLLYEAAGQVARLKMNAIAAQLTTNGGGLLCPPRHSHTCGFTPASTKSPHLHTLYNKQYQDLNWAHNCHNHHQNHQPRRSCGASLGIPQSAWPPLATRQLHHHNQHRQTSGAQMRGLYQGGTTTTRTMGPTIGGVKRQSAGTGVFLPRRVSTSPPRHHHQPPTELRRKPTVMVPTARVNINMDVEETNLKSHLRFGGANFPTDHGNFFYFYPQLIP
ncbi:hypothetical protein RND81_10G135600 [Saponaria officinalis]|uniref:Uncharacterized protein n=1 Tax=Saponaria officinalis TaxID=3572 RepID=A0AAW1I4I7_SAPOF